MAQARKIPDQDVQAIQRLGQEYFEAASAADTARCIATMASDVIIMPPDRPSILGLEQLRRLSYDYHSTYEVKYSLVYDEVEVAGDIAVARATATGTRKSRLDGTTEDVQWRNLWVLRRQSDGSWKFWRIMFNSPTSSAAG
ncbi:MAG: YybH family protein [Burkholderiales bacterium]